MMQTPILTRLPQSLLALAVILFACALVLPSAQAADKEKKIKRDYAAMGVLAGPAPANQSVADMDAKSEGCLTCHVKTDAPTMHVSPAVRLGCVDCHGGNPSVRGNSQLPHDHPDYVGQSEALLCAAQSGIARICEVREPVGLSSRARGLWELPHPVDRGG